MICRETNPLAALVLDAMARYPDRVALRARERDLTYADLSRITAGFAQHLQAEGIGRDSLVGLDPTLKDGTEIALSILALTLLGAQWMMYSVYPEGLPITLTHLLHADPGRAGGGRLRAIEAGAVLRAAMDAPSTWDPQALPGYRSADDTWALSASSGTTGTPKCLRITGRNMTECVLRLTDYVESPVDFSVAALFPRNSYAACIYFFRTLHIGGICILEKDYAYLAEHRVDVVIGSPAHVATLLDGATPPPAPVFGEIRVAGAAMSPPFLSRLLEFTRAVRVGYGSTEVGAVCSRLLHSDDFSRSVGTCQPGAAVEIVDEEGNTLAPGCEGIVRIRTTSHVDGYLGDEQATAQAFRDGWFYPGDRGYLSAAGELYITGRVQDHLNAGGTKIDAVSIDEIMQRTAGVADALCFTEPDSGGSERLAALVVLEPGPEPQQVARGILKSFLRSHLHESVFPRNIYQVDAIPRNENGKPTRHRAAALVDGVRPLARFGTRRGGA